MCAKSRLKELLQDRQKYLRVPDLKFREAEFFLDRINQVYGRISGQPIDRILAALDHEKIGQIGLEISYYADAFLSAEVAFFDTLAIFHTKNRSERRILRRIHFRSWLNYQIKENPTDPYLQSLDQEDKAWIKRLRKNRNFFTHVTQIFASSPSLASIKMEKGKPLVVKPLKTEMADGRRVDLLAYCRDVFERTRNLLKLSNKNIKREYDYKPRLRMSNCR